MATKDNAKKFDKSGKGVTKPGQRNKRGAKKPILKEAIKKRAVRKKAVFSSRLRTLVRSSAQMTSAFSEIAPLQGQPTIRRMTVKAEYRDAANSAKLWVSFYDPKNNRIYGDSTQIVLDPNTNTGWFDAQVGQFYAIDCTFSGLLRSSVQLTVTYPPEVKATAPAAQKKTGNTITNPRIGMMEFYLLVPTKGAIL